MENKCPEGVCFHYWKFHNCKFGDKCRFSHEMTSPKTLKDKRPQRRQKNTVCFEPMNQENVDMRVVIETSKDKLNTKLNDKSVLLVPNMFSDYPNNEIYNKLIEEISNCPVPKEDLLKLWHGNDKIDGTHLIMNDRTNWKQYSPTFKMVIERIQDYFNMKIEATRLNWYKNTEQWKPFHHDSAYVNEDKAAKQNFTVAVSFGVERVAAFEHAKTKTVVSFPHKDGEAYCFCKDTNGIWRHGILQEPIIKEEGRFSVICWGKVDY